MLTLIDGCRLIRFSLNILFDEIYDMNQIITIIKEKTYYRNNIEIIDEKTKIGEKVVVVSQWVKMLDIVKDLVSTRFPEINYAAYEDVIYSLLT